MENCGKAPGFYQKMLHMHDVMLAQSFISEIQKERKKQRNKERKKKETKKETNKETKREREENRQSPY